MFIYEDEAPLIRGGGVMSGVGKGVTSASSPMFSIRALKVTSIKIDPYVNVDGHDESDRARRSFRAGRRPGVRPRYEQELSANKDIPGVNY